MFLRASGISSELINEYESSHRVLIIMSRLRIKTEDFSIRGIRIWKCFKSESWGNLLAMEESLTSFEYSLVP